MTDILSRMDDSMVVGWKTLSFLALNSNEQKQLIGECEYNFFRNDTSKFGANYLFGLLLMANQYVINNFTEELYPDVEQVMELKTNIDRLIYDKKNSSISVDDLEFCQEWEEIRVLSSRILEKLNLHSIKLTKPFRIENYIEDSLYE